MPRRGQRSYGKVRSTIGTIARERVEILLKQARENLDSNPTLSRRYIELAWKVSKRTKVKIPAGDKRYICRGCGLPLILGRNARIRVLSGNPRIVITCLSCGRIKRYPFTKNKRENSRQKSMKPYITLSSGFPRKITGSSEDKAQKCQQSLTYPQAS